MMKNIVKKKLNTKLIMKTAKTVGKTVGKTGKVFIEKVKESNIDKEPVYAPVDNTDNDNDKQFLKDLFDKATKDTAEGVAKNVSEKIQGKSGDYAEQGMDNLMKVMNEYLENRKSFKYDTVKILKVNQKKRINSNIKNFLLNEVEEYRFLLEYAPDLFNGHFKEIIGLKKLDSKKGQLAISTYNDSKAEILRILKKQITYKSA